MDWQTPLIRLAAQPTRHPYITVRRVLAVASDFIDRWSAWAEYASMRPAHLLRNDPAEPMTRGLAWRWMHSSIDVVCFPRKGFIVVLGEELPFVYALEDGGKVRMVFGDERRAIMGAQMELMDGPSVRRKALLSSLDTPNTPRRPRKYV